jgi:tRNA threonylcarbamoyladenosine biosynthesis protein TsaE
VPQDFHKEVARSVQETEAIGKRLGAALSPGDIVLLRGDLGSGKTSFTGGLVQAFGIPREAVSSPTFAIMNRYEGTLPVFHFDLYRLKTAAEARDAGLEDIAGTAGITLIEWPDVAMQLLYPPFWEVELRHTGDGLRSITIRKTA